MQPKFPYTQAEVHIVVGDRETRLVEAAKLLGISLRSLYRYIERLAIPS